MSVLESLRSPAHRPPGTRAERPLMAYAAIGDSFTAGTGCAPGERWPDLVAARLREHNPDFRYSNLAVEGATSERVLADQLAPAVAFAPDLVTVVCGANDVLFSVRPDADAYAGRLATIFHVLGAIPSAPRVLTATAPERWDFLDLGPRTRARLERGIVAFNEATRATSARFAVPCLEVAEHPGLAEAANFVADGLHPSSHGHTQAAAGFARMLGLDPEGER